MPTTTLNPTVSTTPNEGGTTAVTGATTTGHASTLTSAGVSVLPEASDSASQAKSCRWSSFQAAPSGAITSLRLKFNYNVSGSTSINPGDGSASATASFSIEYTLNGGGAWIPVASDSASGNDTISAAGSADIALSTAQNIALVQVRDRTNTAASATGGPFAGADALAEFTTTISGIQLEVVTADSQQILVMM